MKFKLPITIISGDLLLTQQQVAISESKLERAIWGCPARQIALLNPTSPPPIQQNTPPQPQQNIISYVNPNISRKLTLAPLPV